MEEHHPGHLERGTIVLDIGGDVGALVLAAPRALLGREVEIAPAGDGQSRTHTVVREWLVAGQPVRAAVFPALPAGVYLLCDDSFAGSPQIVVEGGHVASATIALPRGAKRSCVAAGASAGAA